MVCDLRYKLLTHLQSLGLLHHITTSTGDSVYRIDVDTYSLENLAMSGVFPLASSIITLVVMFTVLVKLDLSVALLSLSVIRSSFTALLRHVVVSAGRAREGTGIGGSSRGSTDLLVDSPGQGFARESLESQRYSDAGATTMNARIAVTWKQGLFGLMVATTTILGTALVLLVGGMHVMRSQMTVGSLIVVINYLGAVYGHCPTIAFTTGQLRSAVAGARRVRAMLALEPETTDAPGAIGATSVRATSSSRTSASRIRTTSQYCTTSSSRRGGQMIAVVGLTGAGRRRSSASFRASTTDGWTRDD